MANRAPFVFEAWMTGCFLVGLMVGLTGQAACASAPPIVNDGLTIEGRVAICMIENVGQPDETIVSRCSPASTQPAQASTTIRVVLAVCHAEKAAKDAAPDREEGNLWSTRSSFLAFSLPVRSARSH